MSAYSSLPALVSSAEEAADGVADAFDESSVSFALRTVLILVGMRVAMAGSAVVAVSLISGQGLIDGTGCYDDGWSRETGGTRHGRDDRSRLLERQVIGASRFLGAGEIGHDIASVLAATWRRITHVEVAVIRDRVIPRRDDRTVLGSRQLRIRDVIGVGLAVRPRLFHHLVASLDHRLGQQVTPVPGLVGLVERPALVVDWVVGQLTLLAARPTILPVGDAFGDGVGDHAGSLVGHLVSLVAARRPPVRRPYLRADGFGQVGTPSADCNGIVNQPAAAV